MTFLLWQLADSGFPAGGFAHSGGLEASVHHGFVHDEGTVRAFARQALAQAGRSALPLMTAALARPEDLADFDRLSDAFLSNQVANRASRAQGRSFLTSASRSFPQAGLASLEAKLRSEGLAGHHAPMFGAALHVLGVDSHDAQRLFLYMTVRGIGSAAVRLGLIGAYEAQALQARLSADIDEVADRCGALGPLEVAQTSPLIDLCQSTHDRLYSRLFQS